MIFYLYALTGLVLVLIFFLIKQSSYTNGLEGQLAGWKANYEDLRRSSDRLEQVLRGAQIREKKLLDVIATEKAEKDVIPLRMDVEKFKEAVFKLQSAANIEEIKLRRGEWMLLREDLNSVGNIMHMKIDEKKELRLFGILIGRVENK